MHPVSLVACHQPYLLPALSFLAKWRAADALVLLDDARFVDSGPSHLANRCRLGDGWWTVPVHQQEGQAISQVRAVNGYRALESLLSRVRNEYVLAPYRRQVRETIELIRECWDGEHLVDLSLLFLHWMGGLLGIGAPLLRQSATGFTEVDRDVRLIRLVRWAGGNHYLAGPKGPTYMNPAVYQREGMPVSVCRYEPFIYDRGGHYWQPYLSVLDALAYHWQGVMQFLDVTVEQWPILPITPV